MRYFTNPEVPGSLYERTEDTAKAALRHHPTWVEAEPPKRGKAAKKAAKKATHASAQTHANPPAETNKE